MAQGNHQFALVQSNSVEFVACVQGIYLNCKSQIIDCNSQLNVDPKPSEDVAKAINTLKSGSVRRQQWALHQLFDKFAGKTVKGEPVTPLDDAGKKAAVEFIRPMRKNLSEALFDHALAAGVFSGQTEESEPSAPAQTAAA